jgi:hypothetical protein
LLPFGLFTTQIPYVILGVMYLLYIGLAFLNKPELSEASDFATHDTLAGKIEFVEKPFGSDLPVINISSQSVSSPYHFSVESVFETTLSELTFCHYSQRIVKCETLTSIFQSRNITFSLFSRPPPVTA